MQKYNYKINKVALGFDYNENKEVNILNSFYVQAQGSLEYKLPDMFGLTNIKMNFSSDSLAGYGCTNVFSDDSEAYLSASMALGNFSLPSLGGGACCPPVCEDEARNESAESEDVASIDFKLGRFGTQSSKVGADHGDASNRIHLATNSSKMLNGFEMAVRNNAAGDMSAAYFIGTSEDCGSRREISSTMKVTVDAAWANNATTTITVDPVANKKLLETLVAGDKFKDSNGDALFGIGTYVSHTAAGVITINSAELKLAGGVFDSATAVGDKVAEFDGATVGGTVPLVAGNALYGATALTDTNTVAELITTYFGPSPHTGTIAIGTSTVPGGALVATDAIMHVPGGIKKIIADGKNLITSTGKHFTTVPIITGTDAQKTVTVTLSAGNPKVDKVDNNITGFRLKFKLGRFGSMGYEDIETKDLTTGVKSEDTTISVRLGGDDISEDLDQVTRNGATDFLSKFSLDWINHENKVGAATTDQDIIAIQYKLSDDISLMYGQKDTSANKKSDIYGLNYKINVGNGCDALLKVRGQSEANNIDESKIQIQMELPTNLIQYTNQE